MGKNTTSPPTLGRLPLAPLLLAAACSIGADPDPNEVRLRLGIRCEPTSLDDVVIEPAVAELSAAPASAPMVEVASRDVAPPRQGIAVAVGHQASWYIDRDLQAAFQESCPDLLGSFTPATDRDAVELLMVGRVDFALMGGSLSPRERHAGLRQTRLGLELFALAVSADFPARSLSRSQVRQLLTGEVGDWGRFGYDLGPVVAVVPSDRALAERAARTLIPGDDFAAGALRVADERLVVERIQRERGALGVVRIGAVPVAEGLKLLQIDWTPATPEAFGYGTYPFGVPIQLVTSGQPRGAAERFLQFAQSERGRALLGRSMLAQ